MIITVTPNPALDLTWRVERLNPGQTHRVPAGVGRAGGKGLNVSRVLHQVGHDTLAVTTAGGATGARLRADLDAAGVPSLLVPVVAETRSSVAIVDVSRGEVSVLNEFGQAPSAAESETLWASVHGARAAHGSHVVAVSGSLGPGMDVGEVVSAVARLRAEGVSVVVDTSGPALLALADAGATVVKPNGDELREATGLESLDDGIADLLGRGVMLVVLSLGSEGMLLAHRDGRRVRARFPEIVHGNATGAGDSVTAAITVALEDDPRLVDLDSLARRAVAWGAAAVAMPLAGELDPILLGRTAEVIITASEETP